ncbi:MAG: ornithine carbamoyltransferase [Alphaproteobacteria bacterium]|nr:ornithine carbamoyltransferase [Alphaproteobacteria bacterium]
MRHFLDIRDLSTDQLGALLDHAAEMKQAQKAGRPQPQPLAGKSVAMIFEKQSTRTRLSFELGISQLGGQPIMLSASDMQIGRGETMQDTARVMSRYVDAITIRCFQHETLTSLAEHASVPVINALTERSHPCQILADLQTMIERHGALDGQIVTWVGDGNNVTTSWIEASARFGFQLRIACPQAYTPPAELLAWARGEGADIVLYDNAEEAVTDSQTVVTDVWISMGDDEGSRATDFQPFQVTGDLMKRAAGDAIFMHCLPAWRGMEVTADVIDGPQSAVFDEAENRLHAQKAILSWCVADN